VLFHERFDVFVQVHAMPTGFGDADAPIARPSASGALLRNREHARSSYLPRNMPRTMQHAR
jgi:hypothetical protein